MGAIVRFDGDYRFLSNFFPSPIECAGLLYPTVEHAYQAAKASTPEQAAHIRAAVSPGEARRRSHQMGAPPGWAERRLETMVALLNLKFTTHDELRGLLLDTNDDLLVEGNNWGDNYWGVDGHRGENNLGLLLMQLRANLRAVEIGDQ